MTEPAGADVHVQRVGRRHGHVEALGDAIVRVRSGESVAVTGRSGAGERTPPSLIDAALAVSLTPSPVYTTRGG